MVPEHANSAYMPIRDKDSEDASYRGAARWQKISFAIITSGMLACLACLVKPTNLTSADGRLSASIEHGSNSTAFLMDHRLQYVVDGEISITDGMGHTFLGKAGDLFYLPSGSNVSYHTPKSVLTYVVVADKTLPITPTQLATLGPAEYQKRVYENARITPILHFPNLRDRKNIGFEEYKDGLPRGTSSAFFDEVGCFKWTGKQLPSGRFPSWNLCSGIFYLSAGPSFTSGTYPHHYETDFVLDGEFHYHGVGSQKMIAKPGDLVHNPRETDVRIETPEFGKFLTVSLSDVDDFWR